MDNPPLAFNNADALIVPPNETVFEELPIVVLPVPDPMPIRTFTLRPVTPELPKYISAALEFPNSKVEPAVRESIFAVFIELFAVINPDDVNGPLDVNVEFTLPILIPNGPVAPVPILIFAVRDVFVPRFNIPDVCKFAILKSHEEFTILLIPDDVKSTELQ